MKQEESENTVQERVREDREQRKKTGERIQKLWELAEQMSRGRAHGRTAEAIYDELLTAFELGEDSAAEQAGDLW